MTLVRLMPRTGLESLSRDPFFRGLFDALDNATEAAEPRAWYPPMDFVDDDDKLVVSVEVPGLEPKDVQVTLQDDVLTVSGERKFEAPVKGKVLKREQMYGNFTRTIELPYRVQADKVKAQYKNGVMTIALPKAEEHIGRSIPVEIEN